MSVTGYSMWCDHAKQKTNKQTKNPLSIWEILSLGLAEILITRLRYLLDWEFGRIIIFPMFVVTGLWPPYIHPAWKSSPGCIPQWSALLSRLRIFVLCWAEPGQWERDLSPFPLLGGSSMVLTQRTSKSWRKAQEMIERQSCQCELNYEK